MSIENFANLVHKYTNRGDILTPCMIRDTLEVRGIRVRNGAEFKIFERLGLSPNYSTGGENSYITKIA